jgi:hypothetical protein
VRLASYPRLCFGTNDLTAISTALLMGWTPVSHLVTVLRVTPSFFPKAVWLRPSWSRMRRSSRLDNPWMLPHAEAEDGLNGRSE